MPRYELTLRPFDVSVVPDGWTAVGSESGWERYNGVYGWVEYAEPLLYCQMWTYDLQPVDPQERARFALWMYWDREDDKVSRYLARWDEISTADLRQMMEEGFVDRRLGDLLLALR